VTRNSPFIDSNMAFVGYVESVSNLYTSEIRSMCLEDIYTSNYDMETMKKSTRFYKRNCITTFGINHNDEYVNIWVGIHGGRRTSSKRHLLLTLLETIRRKIEISIWFISTVLLYCCI